MSLEDNRYPLSAAQAGLWFAQQIDTTNPSFSGGQYVEIHGPIDAGVLCRAIVQSSARSESFNVQFGLADDGPYQTPVHHDVSVTRVDLSDRPAGQAEATAKEWMRSEMGRPVDLQREMFFSSAVLTLSADRHFWFQRCHHIVCDGYASALFAGTVAELYTRMMAREPGDATSSAEPEDALLLEPMPTFGSLDEVLADDRDYRASETFAQDRAFWMDRLANRPDVLGLTDGTAQPGHDFHRRTVEIAADVKDDVESLGREARTSWSVVICAATALYLSRVRGTREVVIGLPVAVRFGPLMKHTPSMMANVLPVLVDVDPSLTSLELVKQVSAEIRLALKHQRYRFEDLRRDLRLRPDQRLYGPSVDVLRFQGDLEFAGARATVHILSNGPVEDLNLAVYSGASIPGLRVSVDANPRLYTEAATADHRDRFATVLRSFAGCPSDTPIGQVDVVEPDRIEEILRDWSGPARAIPDGRFTDLFQAQVARTPEATAVTCAELSLTYAELNDRANRLARLLVSGGAAPERFVGIALARSLDMMVAILAVLKSGAAYLPLDTSYPADRIEVMVREADPVLILTSADTADALPAFSVGRQLRPGHPEQALTLAGLDGGDLNAAELAGPLDPRQPAYAIYTSGSTGRPKGVVIPHRNLVDFLLWAADTFPIEAGRPLLAVSSLSFDPSVLELLSPVIAGGSVEILDGPLALGSRPLTGSYACTIPSVYATLAADEGAPELQLSTVGVHGEALTEQVADGIRLAHPGCRIANLYGPTEVTVYATAGFSSQGPAPSIGKALPNTQLLVLDTSLRLVPVGVPGELYVAGAGLSRGYLNQPRGTADRFVANPYARDGSRMYRTGDLVRRREGGSLDYLGRSDFQLKIRGNRVELGEVESVLAGLAGVAQAAVVARNTAAGELTLIGYVTPDADARPDPAELRAALSARLPGYMVPAEIVGLADFPRMPSGKLDRRALPEPEVATRPPGREPRNDVEATICSLVSDLLQVPHVSIDDDFFDLGGNSLLATRLTARIRNTLGLEVDLRTVFDRPTVAQLVEAQHSAPAVKPRPALRARARPLDVNT